MATRSLGGDDVEGREEIGHTHGVRRWHLAAVVGLVALVSAGALWLFHPTGDTSNELLLYGNVEVREVDVAFNEGDRIVAMHVEEGDPVAAGQLLAELDDSRLEHVVFEAEAKVAAQRAVVARLEVGSRPEEIERARAEMAAAQAELADARVTHERLEKLARSDAASRQQLDDARAGHLAARARVGVARENLRLAVEGARSEDILAARAQLWADANALELARHRLADTKLFAPEAATVRVRIVEPGAVVLPNTPVYTLALADPVWVRAYLTETDLGRVFPGMKAEISGDSFPDRPHTGWVGFISPTAEFTPKPVETPDLRTSLVYRMRIYVHNPDHSLRQGMPVTVRLPLDQEPASPSPGSAGESPPRAAPAGPVTDPASPDAAPTREESGSRTTR
jgi:HlyD family secretion protein